MKTIIALFLLTTASLCWGQDKITSSDRALLALDGAAKVADFYFTTRNVGLETICRTHTSVGNYCFSGYGSEANPLARPFVIHGRPLAAAYFAGTFAMEAVLSHELRRHGHPKIARAVLFFGIADSTLGAATSAHGGTR